MSDVRFYTDMATITRTLDNVEIKQGAREAKTMVRATIAGYIRADEKSVYDYGVFLWCC